MSSNSFVLQGHLLSQLGPQPLQLLTQPAAAEPARHRGGASSSRRRRSRTTTPPRRSRRPSRSRSCTLCFSTTGAVRDLQAHSQAPKTGCASFRNRGNDHADKLAGWGAQGRQMAHSARWLIPAAAHRQSAHCLLIFVGDVVGFSRT